MATKLFLDTGKREAFEQKVRQIHLLASCIGWSLVDLIIFLPLVCGGNKRIRKKKARRLRVRWIGEELREAGLTARRG